MRRGLVVVALALLSAPVAVAQELSTPDEARTSRKRAAEYLLANQRTDSSTRCFRSPAGGSC